MADWRAVVEITSPDLGGMAVNTHHFHTNVEADEGAALNDWADALEDLYTAINFVFAEDTTITFDGQAVQVGDPTPELHTDLHTWSVVGGTTTDNLPPANALCITWRTFLASRSGRGRTFLGPVSRDLLQDNGTPLESARSDISDAANAYISHFGEPASFYPIVWSQVNESGLQMASASVPNEFAMLRSRRD